MIIDLYKGDENIMSFTSQVIPAVGSSIEFVKDLKKVQCVVEYVNHQIEYDEYGTYFCDNVFVGVVVTNGD